MIGTDVVHSWAPRLLGVDFTSAPTRRKPITVARGSLQERILRFERLDTLATFLEFERLLQEEGPWLGGFDFPFGLPREFLDSLALGSSSKEIVRTVRERCGNRMGLRHLVDEWGNGRTKGTKLLHRRTDTAMPGVCSSSPLQTRYVPVGFMYFEGFSRLIDAEVTVPGMNAGSADRVAIEAYPGLLAFELMGRCSYKNNAGHDRLIARLSLIDALEQGRPERLGLRLKLTHAQREALVADWSGDRLDAVLCLVQAAWASSQPAYGLPPDLDPLEGWIATAPWKPNGR